jgi:tRNA dimethylallyltransferase
LGTPDTAVIVAGPTASGKSALALDLARSWGGTVINADAMQVYAELRVLTARPTAAEEARVPHRLYGVRPAAQPGSVGWWRQAALAELRRAWGTGSVPILCGGTGMYLAALTGGLADIPDPGPAARQAARALLAEIGPAALHARLARADPRTAALLRPSDSQRLARAWEVLTGTGHGLAHWQAQAGTPAAAQFSVIWLDPPRPALRTAIAQRLDAMLAAGALHEVAALLAANLDPALPAMRAHGVPELSAHLRGDIDLDEARTRTVAATARYTKRQATWLRHHALAPPERAHRINARYAGLTQLSQSQMTDLNRFVRGQG